MTYYYSRVFGSIGKNCDIETLISFSGGENIIIGDNVRIASHTWLSAINFCNQECKLIIENGAIIGHFNHIFATKLIKIEHDVLIADKVYISDNMHNYENVLVPICKQPIKQLSPVIIGSGSWIGENVCIIGSSIGKHCVIGANAVITKDIPDYCVAVGAPAKVIKRYDFTENRWKNE